MFIQPIRSTTLRGAVYNAIFRAIVSGIIPPGNKLTLEDLAKKLGVIIMPVRQGVNQSILFKLPAGISAFDPSNIFALEIGPLVGTSAPGACRTNIDTVNLFTGRMGSSNVGGHFAAN